MNKIFLNNLELPFCKGCGHTLIAESTEKALQATGLSPLDIVLVTDIGCHGLVDGCFNTHTVHGLHGRSVALASGVVIGLDDPSKKVIAFLGDGGATIGMQHLIDAAHNNFNMTVVLHNNMLYGMTGGQPSEFTPSGFKTPTLPTGAAENGYDICELLVAAGASYVQRIIGIGDISEALAVAFSKKGFSFVEVIEICPSYGVKSNPGMKLAKLAEDAGLKMQVFVDRNTEGYKTPPRTPVDTLIPETSVIPVTHSAKIPGPVSIMMSGSAGEGVQVAAEFIAKAAIMSGLQVTKKGSYPVTVGIGFSSADIIISPKKIQYTGSPSPDVLIITSVDGLKHALPTLKNMKEGLLLVDETLDVPQTGLEVVRKPFREAGGAKTAGLASLLYYLKNYDSIPVEALLEVMGESKLASKLNIEKLLAL